MADAAQKPELIDGRHYIFSARDGALKTEFVFKNGRLKTPGNRFGTELGLMQNLGWVYVGPVEKEDQKCR